MTPVERFLADPDRVTGDLSRRLVEVVASIDGDRIAAVVGVAVVVAAARGVLRSWRYRRLTAGARVVAIQPPPDVDPTGAEALWTTLHDLLHPAWKRLVYGQPHAPRPRPTRCLPDPERWSRASCGSPPPSGSHCAPTTTPTHCAP